MAVNSVSRWAQVNLSKQLRDGGVVVLEFFLITTGEGVVLVSVVVIPFAQLVTGRNLFGPVVEPCVLLADTAWPQTINQHARAVVIVRVIVNALPLNVHGLAHHSVQSLASCLTAA